MSYLHGTYGMIADEQTQDASQAGTASAYIGTAPVNLIRGYAQAGIINMPIRLRRKTEAENQIGCSEDWTAFTLCEAVAAHFDNRIENVGPIYVINVLDPDTDRSADKTTETLIFTKKRAYIRNDKIILDTFAIADKVEGVDYSIAFDFSEHAAVVTLLGEDAGTEMECSYYTVDTAGVTKDRIIGEETENGTYTGIHALKLMYQYNNVVLTNLAAPGWSQIPEVYRAMIGIVQQLNGHWEGFVSADIPLEDAEGEPIDTLAKAIKWKEDNEYSSEHSKVYWPKVVDADGRVFHLSTVGQATMLRVDLSHDGIPFETPSNKEIMAAAQYFGAESENRGFDQNSANKLNEAGITTACYWAGRWVLWGPHTAAYQYGDESLKTRVIFDGTMRILKYLVNQFQIDHGIRIDQPMTVALRDTILNAEKAKLDMLVSIGALVGTPTVQFLENENSMENMMNGDFVWDIIATVTPPFKSGTVKVYHTNEGFAALFGEE